MSAPIPRFLVPRGYIIPYVQLPRPLRSLQILDRTLPFRRNASASTSKPQVLEKPTRFNPPSHGKRLKQQIPRQYGPQLTAEQKTEQETKKYPNMMPAPGTFMHWFLTNQSIHVYITMGTLALLASITAFERWRVANEFREQLPPASDFFVQPLATLSKVWYVYCLTTAKRSAESHEIRERNIDDIQKRNTYRIAHGLMDENAEGLGPWKGGVDTKVMRSGARADGEVFERPVGVEPGQEVEAKEVTKNEESSEGLGKNRKRRERPIKKWLGIW